MISTKKTYIKGGLTTYVDRSLYCIDKYHMTKYINKSANQMLDEAEFAKEKLYRYLYKKQRGRFKAYTEEMLESANFHFCFVLFIFIDICQSADKTIVFLCPSAILFCHMSCAFDPVSTISIYKHVLQFIRVIVLFDILLYFFPESFHSTAPFIQSAEIVRVHKLFSSSGSDPGPAEGHVSHVLSDRLSSCPMGWSQTGADRMSKLRCYERNH